MDKAAWVAPLLAAGVLAGCATPVTRHEARLVGQEDQLPASYPRLDPNDLQGRAKFDEAVKAWFAPPAADRPQPKLVCDEPNAPLKTIWKGQVLTSAWEIRNAGGATLRVWIDA
jgi:hypothetical protein